MQIHLAEIIAASLILLSAAIGAGRGLLMMVYSLVRLVLLLVLTALLTPLLLPLIPEEPIVQESLIPADLMVREGEAFILSLLLSLIILAVAAHLLRIVDRIPVLNTLNKLGGFLIGAVFGIILVWLSLFIIGSFQDAPWCQTAAAYVQESPVLSEIQKINPITYVMQIFS